MEHLLKFICGVFTFFLLSQLSHGASDAYPSIEKCLVELGKNRNLYFTFENTYVDIPQYVNLSSPFKGDLRDLAKMGSSLKLPKDTMPGYLIAVDPGNPQIIHFVDKHLLEQKNYFLNRTFDKISFRGTFENFISYLDPTGEKVAFDNSGPIEGGMILPSNQSKECNIEKYSITVRDALSEPMASNQFHILWTATTDIKKNKTFVSSLYSKYELSELR